MSGAIPPARAPSSSGFRKRVVRAFGPVGLILLLAWGVGLLTRPAAGGADAPDKKEPPKGELNAKGDKRPVGPRGALFPEEKARIELFKRCKDGVANLNYALVLRGLDLRLLQNQMGYGSGCVWDDQGHVVTNYHVIRGLNLLQGNIRVTLADRSVYNARIVGTAPDFDLAVLQIDAPKEKLKPIPLGTSSGLEVGQDVYAIGNPYGQNLTLTRGIISAVDREIYASTGAAIPGAIQTDAAINPGNSGGPLLDSAGRMIGINTAGTTPSGGSAGVGFAVPVNLVNEIVPELIRNGKVARRPALGVKLLTERMTRALGYEKGLLIQDVLPNGPADKAGLLPLRRDVVTGDLILGDRILSVDGQEVSTFGELEGALRKRKVGDKVKLGIDRDGKKQDVEVLLEGS